MAIELSNLMFTEQDDLVPQSGMEEIVNSGIANTLAGNDTINGRGGIYSILNIGTLNTADGNDIITAIRSFEIIEEYPNDFGAGIRNEGGTIDTGDGNDTLTGVHNFNQRKNSFDGYGIDNERGIINTGNGDDLITGLNQAVGGVGIRSLSGIINTGDGSDRVIATARVGISSVETAFNTGNGDDRIEATSNTEFGVGIVNQSGSIDTGADNDLISGSGFVGIANTIGSTINTGDGNDRISSISNQASIENYGTINTGNGYDSIISRGGNLINWGEVLLGDGNDSLAYDDYVADVPTRTLENFNFIGTGDGNDTITSTGAIYNQGIIETGDGDDFIIVDGGVDGTGTGYGIYNNGGAINTGDGKDSIIANEGFDSGPNSSGAWFLGEGDDYIKGFGSGDFYGGNGFDTLELTPGSYTLQKWTDNTGESVIFTKGNSLMITSEFEQLIAGGTTYDFTSLTAGQIIIIS
jgi:hypothetical protein